MRHITLLAVALMMTIFTFGQGSISNPGAGGGPGNGGGLGLGGHDFELTSTQITQIRSLINQIAIDITGIGFKNHTPGALGEINAGDPLEMGTEVIVFFLDGMASILSEEQMEIYNAHRGSGSGSLMGMINILGLSQDEKLWPIR